jgi:hypothetical protein
MAVRGVRGAIKKRRTSLSRSWGCGRVGLHDLRVQRPEDRCGGGDAIRRASAGPDRDRVGPGLAARLPSRRRPSGGTPRWAGEQRGGTASHGGWRSSDRAPDACRLASRRRAGAADCGLARPGAEVLRIIRKGMRMASMTTASSGDGEAMRTASYGRLARL